MAGGSGRWRRRLLVGQLALAWPCSLLLWWQGGPVAVAVAVIVLWVGALTCVAGLLGLPWRDERSAEPASPSHHVRATAEVP